VRFDERHFARASERLAALGRTTGDHGAVASVCGCHRLKRRVEYRSRDTQCDDAMWHDCADRFCDDNSASVCGDAEISVTLGLLAVVLFTGVTIYLFYF
jgi:hypothetical protein